MGLPAMAEKTVEKIWKTISWATHGGDVRVIKALRPVLGWGTTTWRRNRSAWSMKTDPANVTRWKHKFGFHNRGVWWDLPPPPLPLLPSLSSPPFLRPLSLPPVSKWVEEKKDWIQLMTRHPPCKEDATVSLLKMMRQPTAKKQGVGGIHRKKPRELSPLVLEPRKRCWKSEATAKWWWTGSTAMQC